MVDKILEEIKRDPYTFIRNYYEELYPHMGRKVMSILCLLPPSLILPPLIDTNGKRIRTRMSFLLLAPPGTAKSALSEHFKKFTYDPFPFEAISDSKINFVLSYKKRATLINSDVARTFADRELVKEMENIIGDEGKLSRLNRNTGDEEQKIAVIGYFSGTPDNLTRTIQDGMVFRVCPMIIYHTEKEHAEILEKVNDSIGRGVNENFVDREHAITEFYKILLAIQEQDKDALLPSVEGFVIPEIFREKIKKELIPSFNKPFKETNFEFVRELQQCYRYMVTHAFLNVFTRKIENHKLHIEESDLRVAIALSKREIETKLIILNSLNKLSEKKFRNTNELKLWSFNQKRDNQPISFEEYKTMETLIKSG